MEHSNLSKLEQVAQQKKDVFAQNAGKCNKNSTFLQPTLRVFRRFSDQVLRKPTGPARLLSGHSSPSTAMPLSVSKAKDWQINSFLKVPFHLVICDELTPNSRLLLMFFMNQVGYKTVSMSVVDRLIGFHRSTRIRCLAELKELGFIEGSDSHIVLNDPQPILANLKNSRKKTLDQAYAIMSEDEFMEDLSSRQREKQIKAQEAVKRDFLQEATDAWNRYRPKDYQKIRNISAQLIKAVDIHMQDLRVSAHHYEEFFSILKAGIEKSDFWSNQNSTKTLQSITGVGMPTDKKKGNVYSLFNDGVQQPAAPTEEQERSDTIVYPAKYRKLIDEYESAQTLYNEAYRNRALQDDHRQYVIRTERELTEAGLDPAQFRFKYGIREWPTEVKEPAESRVVNWSFDDEYGNAY
jgi:hypothetical protein